MAALRMKGVVSPQHAPTIKKPRIQRKMDGCGSFATGVSGSIDAMTNAIQYYTILREKKGLRCRP